MKMHAVASVDGRGQGIAMPAAVLAAILLAGLAYLTQGPESETEPQPVRALPYRPALPAPATVVAAPVPEAPTTLAAPETPRALPQAAVPLPAPRVALAPAHPPYRFIGRTSSGDQSAIVLFGRGRVVTMEGPGPIDDEYMVEAMFDDYLVLRHVQTGAGTFLQYGRRRPAAQPQQDPEDIPYD
jgi:hypothetical protein